MLTDCSYTKALEFCNDKEHISSIQINRAQAYLRVKCHDDALADLASVLSKHPNHQKAHSRAGRALYELGRFEGCNAHLKKLRPSSINKRDRSYMGRLKEREREALGSYDFDTMRKEPTYDSPFLDHANFQGPVEARRSGERGRGLFLTRDVKAGHLLLCEKAFSSIFEDPKSYPKLFTDEHAAEKDRLSQEAKISLTDDIVQKLFHNPSLSPGFLDLHRGSYPLGPTPPKEIGPVIDTYGTELFPWKSPATLTALEPQIPHRQHPPLQLLRLPPDHPLALSGMVLPFPLRTFPRYMCWNLENRLFSKPCLRPQR